MAPMSLMDLPNEVLIHMLTPFSTHSLLEAALVCTRFHDLVLRILHHRLALAASLKEHKIIFELYHPTLKNIDPYLFCDYLGTPGLNSNDGSRDEPLYFEHDGQTGFGRLGSLYSLFRPVPPEEMARLRRPNLNAQAGDALQQHDESARQLFGPLRVLSNEPSCSRRDVELERPLASYPVHLDHDEGFTQLSVVTNLVKVGPRRGLFEHIVNVSDSTTRLKREWMRNVAASTLNVEAGVESKEGDSMRTLWVDSANNIGLKVRMKERTARYQEAPLMYREADPAVSYKMEYDDNSASIESLNSVEHDNDSLIWGLAEEAADADEGPITVEERISRLAVLLLQRDGLVRSETWV